MTRTIIQLYRGTTAQNDAFTGSAGELSFDTTTNQVRVHDGTTVGGHIIGSGSGYHPDLFSWQWADHELNDVQWLRADTFSWQSGAVYQAAYKHLLDDLTTFVCYRWGPSDAGGMYTLNRQPSVGDNVYNDNVMTQEHLVGTVSNYDEATDTITVNSNDYAFGRIVINVAQSSETISGTTIYFWIAPDGHKIVSAGQESNVAAIYAATGVAWYYIIDIANKRFKLPRTQFGVTGYRGTVGGYIEAGLPNITGTFNQSAYDNIVATGAFGTTSNSSRCANGGDDRPVGTFDASRCSSVYGRASTVQPKATQMYLYFYVGNFTQTALENTAGLNASLFNGKVDIGHDIIDFQEPTAQNNYTWYRKYRDGWVEQGGRVQSTSVDYQEQTVTFPIEMADIGYMVTITPESSYGSTMDAKGYCFFNPTTTSMKVAPQVNTITWGNYWQVSGKAA